MPPLDLARAAVGDRIQHELLVLERHARTTQSGDPYLVLTLGNPTGSIDTAPLWPERLDWADGAEPGRVVQALGTVSSWGRGGQARRQLQLAAPLRVLPAEAFRAEAFLPRIAVEPVRLWDWIDETRGRFTSQTLRRVLDAFFGDDEFRLQFERWPAAVSGPHARLGGLLLHVWEVTRIAQQIARTLRGAHVELVVTGALLHDLGKLDAYAIGATGFTLTPAGLLVGPVVQGVRRFERGIAERAAGVLRPEQNEELVHLLVAHRGSTAAGSPVAPATLEAEILHWADEASATGTELIETLVEGDGEAGWGVERAAGPTRRPGRRLWRRPHSWE